MEISSREEQRPAQGSTYFRRMPHSFKSLAAALLTGLSFLGNPLHAQDCGTAPPTPAQYAHTKSVISRIDVDALRGGGITCVPLQAHIVRQGDGSGGITQEQLNIGLSFLNNHFLDAGIQFFWKGAPNTTNNSDYYDFDATSPDNDSEATLAGFFTTATDAVNIYFVNNITTSTGFVAAGYAYFPFNSATSNRVVMRHGSTANTPNGTFVHEFGHYFDLYHTHEGTENGNAHPNAENVARTGGQANCNTDGDLLCDTEADPRYASADFNSSTCTYTGAGVDIHGVGYDPPVDNIMSYFPDGCGGIFTPQQYVRMQQGLMERQGHSAYSLNASPTAVNVPTGLSATWNGASEVDLTWTDNAGNDLGYLIERSETSASSGFQALVFGATATNGTSWTDDDLTPNTTYWYRVRPANGSCASYSNVATVSVGLAYCVPEYFETCAAGGSALIDAFQLAGETMTINNSNSNCSPNGFGDFTAMVADLDAGSTYSVTVDALVGAGSYSPQFAQVWIDLDQNGSFEDAGEKMLATPGSMTTEFTANFTIPPTALNGPTRLRVRSWDQFNGCDPTSCSFCAFGETEEYTVVISGGASADVKVALRVFLEGPYDPSTGSMSDALRSGGLVPTTEPYTALGWSFTGGGGESIAASVLNTTGNNAIVDWVVVELRDKNNDASVVSSRAALLQRDGDVVDLDGSSPVTMASGDDQYYVAVRHRNHLGVMTQNALALSGTATSVNFTSAGQATYGSNARKSVTGAFPAQVLWAGNVVVDDQVKYTGTGNDRDLILQAIGGVVPTNTAAGYLGADVDLNGQVKYTGSDNDRDIILQNIGGVVPTNTRVEQLP